MNKINSLYIVGDSISKGCVQNLEPGRRYSVYSKNLWKVVSETNGWNLINNSVFGSTIEKGHRQLTKDIAAGLKSDVCVVEFGGNDSDYRWPELFEKGEENFLPNTKYDDFVMHLSEMVNEIKDAGMFPVLMTLPPLVADRYFNVISNGLDKEKLLQWMHDPYFLYREQEMYSDAVGDFAASNGIYLINMRRQFLKRRDSPELMCDDGIHPNVKGHEFMAAYINSILGV